MGDIYRLGEMIIEEIAGYTHLKGEYKVTSMECIYDNTGCLRDRKVSVVEIQTNSIEFWKIILDMMRKIESLKLPADELEKKLGNWSRRKNGY